MNLVLIYLLPLLSLFFALGQVRTCSAIKSAVLWGESYSDQSRCVLNKSLRQANYITPSSLLDVPLSDSAPVVSARRDVVVDQYVAFRGNFFVYFGKYDPPLYLYCIFPREYATDLSAECFRTSVIEINHMAERFLFGSSVCRPLDRLPLIYWLVTLRVRFIPWNTKSVQIPKLSANETLLECPHRIEHFLLQKHVFDRCSFSQCVYLRDMNWHVADALKCSLDHVKSTFFAITLKQNVLLRV